MINTKSVCNYLVRSNEMPVVERCIQGGSSSACTQFTFTDCVVQHVVIDLKQSLTD